MSKQLPTILCASLTLLACSRTQSLAAAVQLVTDGKPRAVIVIGAGAGDLTRRAAAELESYIEQLSGVRLPQATQVERRPADEELVFVGTAAQNSWVKEMAQAASIPLTDLKPEGFVIKTLTWSGRPALLVAGADEAGTLYAVYELLERLGITFRLTGDIVPPKQPALTVADLAVRMEPAFRRRGFLHSAYFDNASIYSYADYQRLLDQMSRMKCNYLQFWWFAYAPWVNYSYRGEAKSMGDVSAKESGYHTWIYNGFGSRTIQDVSIGREHFKDRPRLAPPELQQVQTPEEAFSISQDLLRCVIAYAATRNIKVWPVVEMASLPPNLARHGEIVGPEPFNYVFGTLLHPLDPVNREIQLNRLKAVAETYPQAEGIFLNFPELYVELANDKHHEFFERERSRFQELRPLSAPWSAALANFYETPMERVVDSNSGYLDLFSYLLTNRDEVALGKPLGLMTTGRGYALPLFHKMLPESVPFASLESSGVWTMLGLPMSYFGGMGSRERILQPRIDDDFDMLGMQFSVRQYAEKDRIFIDGAKYGLSGFAGQVERARGTEFNSSFLAQAAWDPALTPEHFYHRMAERMFGSEAAPEMYQAFMKLEENQAYLGYYEYDGGYGVLLCCSAIREVNAVHEYWRQKNPYRGPVMRSWKNLIRDAADMIARREGSIARLEEAVAHLQAASSNVAPQGKYELGYLINRTEVFRNSLAAMNTFRRGLVQFDDAFRHRNDEDEADFVAELEIALHEARAGHLQIEDATRKYSRLIDHPSDLAVLYHLNARAVLGTDLALQFLENVVNYHRGKPYLNHVPFERLFPQRPDLGAEE